MQIPLKCKQILEKLNASGYKAYLVGGAVRDALLGEKNDDYDIATSALPEEVKKVFPTAKVIETGIKHGTITLFYNGFKVEATTFRRDGAYSDNRRPNEVVFLSDIKEDLSRRDFTVNALAADAEGNIVDFFDGKKDIENKIIKCVGDPDTRFSEDALRILRAMRFASCLNFKIDKQTKEALDRNKKLLHNISNERIYLELTKLLCGQNAANVLYENSSVLFELLPELLKMKGFDQLNPSHHLDVFEHTLKAIELCEDIQPDIMWALLFHDSGKPYSFIVDKNGVGHFPDHMQKSAELAENALKNLKAPSKIIEMVKNLTLEHDVKILPTNYEVKKFLFKFGTEFFKKLLVIKKADLYAHSDFGVARYYEYYTQLCEVFNKIITNGECFNLAQLKINGNDLISYGFVPNEVGKTLLTILDAVMAQKVKNDKNELINYLKKLLKNSKKS